MAMVIKISILILGTGGIATLREEVIADVGVLCGNSECSPDTKNESVTF